MAALGGIPPSQALKFPPADWPLTSVKGLRAPGAQFRILLTALRSRYFGLPSKLWLQTWSLPMQLSPPLREPSDVPAPGPAFLLLPKTLGESEETNLPALSTPKKKTQITVPLKFTTQATSSRIELHGGKGIANSRRIRNPNESWFVGFFF